MRCHNCGTDNHDGAEFCGACGHRVKERKFWSFKDQAYWNLSPEEKKVRLKHTSIAIIMAIVAILVLAAFLPVCHADLKVTVTSEHILASVDYVIYVNGDQVAEGTLPAMESQTWTIPYEFAWMFSGKKDITITATSIGGGLGTQTDSEALLVADGNAYYVTLTI